MTRANASFADRLLQWFDENRRDLPWRRSRDPWAIWVSEVMLQQTRVEAVRAAWERFVGRFPTPRSFAAASDDELFAAWQGLGYYRRARLLRDGARTVVTEHGGRVPAEPGALSRLPGVGGYTTGAIASIAFGLAEVAVDGNVERVASRLLGTTEDPTRAAGARRIRAFVEERIDRSRPGDFNQALMELGATVCSPTSPACSRCPVARDCAGRAKGIAADLPIRRPRRKPIPVCARVALVVGQGGALGVRVPQDQPNAGQVELPGGGVLTALGHDELGPRLRERFGARLEIGEVLATVRHTITHHKIELHAHAAGLRARGRLAWHPIDGRTPWTTASRKVFRKALGEGAWQPA